MERFQILILFSTFIKARPLLRLLNEIRLFLSFNLNRHRHFQPLQLVEHI